MLIKIDEIVSGVGKKKDKGSAGPSQPAEDPDNAPE